MLEVGPVKLKYWQLACLLFLGEIALNYLIIQKIPYTEIDWIAYMEEVAPVVDHKNYDYSQLEGNTGIIVYPAGFVYIYSLLYKLTHNGKDIRMAQYLFMVLYLATIAVLFAIYSKSKKIRNAIWVIILLCVSRRIHSIFVLRLFNDCFATFFVYLSIYYMQKDKWTVGCMFFSIAVSVKMNILLFAPGLFFLLMKRYGLGGTFSRITICGIIQLVFGLPFLLENHTAYLKRSFDLGRKFFYIWTVNWKFLPEEFFVSTTWALTLLFLTLAFWLFFAKRLWIRYLDPISYMLKALMEKRTRNEMPDADEILLTMFTSNFIGIVFSRTLHFQFYVWYFHTLPYLLWSIRMPTIFRLGLLAAIEFVWNVFPSRAETSLLLFVCHLIILFGLYLRPDRKSVV